MNETAMKVLLVKNKVRSINSDYVFLNTVRKEIDARNLLRAYYAARKKARLTDVRFHDLRHTFATRLVQAGVDLYKVQKLMRHKSPIMTQRYAHHYPESLRGAVEVLDTSAKNSEISTNLAHSAQIKNAGQATSL